MKTKFYTLLVILAIVAMFGSTFATEQNPVYVDSGISHKRAVYTAEFHSDMTSKGGECYQTRTDSNLPYCYETINESSAPIVTTSDSPDETVTNIPVPTDDKPKLTPIPAPNKDDTESTCKNKNSGKDGTPKECNAGKGQEK